MRRDGRVEFVKPIGSGGAGGALGALGRGGGEDDGGGGGDVVWVYWKTPDEWAELIEAWVDDTAQKGTVLTLYELSQGEDTMGTGEFYFLQFVIFCFVAYTKWVRARKGETEQRNDSLESIIR
jgi:ESCRT-II complex subunit VPS25